MMQKIVAFALVFTMCACLCACSDDAVMELTDDTSITNSGQCENLTSAEETRIVGNSHITKQQLFDRYGGGFSLRRSFGLNNMELIRFQFDETSVKRQHLDSMKDDVPTHTGTWEIVDGELVITGEWNETFTLDLDANTAISKTDGEVYRIPERDDSLTQYGVLQEVVLTWGFPIELRMFEGMEVTIVTLWEDHAERAWKNNNQQTMDENLSWSIDGDCLTVSGDLEESFIIDIESGTAISQSSGTEYRILVMKDGECSFLVE